MPDALDRKYSSAGKEWGWFWVFPSASMSIDPRSGIERRHHTHEQALQRAIKSAIKAAGIAKPASTHTLRHNPECLVMPSRPEGTAGFLA
jgi:integrase